MEPTAGAHISLVSPLTLIPMPIGVIGSTRAVVKNSSVVITADVLKG